MSFPYIAALSWRAVSVQYVSTSALHVGALGMTEDGSMYRLCLAGGTISSSLAAAINAWTYLTGVTGSCAEAALSTAIAVGDVDFTFADTNTRAKDYYKDGYMVQPSGTYDCIRHIWKSDVAVAADDKVKCYVSAPFTIADAVGNTVQCYPNPWGNVKTPNAAYPSGNEHFVCVPPAPITSGKYFWGQVHGPHWLWFAGIGGNWPGADANDRELYFHINGAVDLLDRRVHTGAISPQRAGYLMYSGDYGDVMTFLLIE